MEPDKSTTLEQKVKDRTLAQTARVRHPNSSLPLTSAPHADFQEAQGRPTCNIDTWGTQTILADYVSALSPC
jgi:hypothetical protein